jgi:hypothetical protein
VSHHQQSYWYYYYTRKYLSDTHNKNDIGLLVLVLLSFVAFVGRGGLRFISFFKSRCGKSVAASYKSD